MARQAENCGFGSEGNHCQQKVDLGEQEHETLEFKNGFYQRTLWFVSQDHKCFVQN